MAQKIKALFAFLLIIAFVITLTGCKQYLDERPDKSLVIPKNLEDLQGLLDANYIMNNASYLGEESADNYYLKSSDWSSLSNDDDKNIYVWGEANFDEIPNDWSRLYQIIYNANVALEYLKTMSRNEQNRTSWDNIKGSAFFFRAEAFFWVAINWTTAYDSATAEKDPGIPLRLSTDFNEVSTRSTIKDTYQQIIQDLKAAVSLLPIAPLHVMRPSKPAAYGLLSRVYLYMGDYTRAGMYADSCLQLFHTLMDYNTIDTIQSYPIPVFNPEVIFHSIVVMPQNLDDMRAIIDSSLYESYQSNDLRKLIFFKPNSDGSFRFNGSYNGSWILFMGIATDEIYLTRAECYAREGKTKDALSDLNLLLSARWRKNTFTSLDITDPKEVLNKILTERRKELLMRGLRWMDLKRLNKEPEYSIKIQRNLNGIIYELKANDPRYSLPIPRSVISLSGMLQNPRH